MEIQAIQYVLLPSQILLGFAMGAYGKKAGWDLGTSVFMSLLANLCATSIAVSIELMFAVAQ
jgi:hypothetical protein